VFSPCSRDCCSQFPAKAREVSHRRSWLYSIYTQSFSGDSFHSLVLPEEGPIFDSQPFTSVRLGHPHSLYPTCYHPRRPGRMVIILGRQKTQAWSQASARHQLPPSLQGLYILTSRCIRNLCKSVQDSWQGRSEAPLPHTLPTILPSPPSAVLYPPPSLER